MDDLIGRAVFEVGNRSYGWEDVVLAAKLSGEWDAFERNVRQGLACEKRADELGDGPSEEELDAAATEFRYERDLVSAEDMESWLERRGLSAEAWMGFLGREWLRRERAADLEQIEHQFPVGEEELQAALAADGLCGGDLGRFAIRLAARVAAAESLRASRPSSTDDVALPGRIESRFSTEPADASSSQRTAVETEEISLDDLPRALRALPADQLTDRIRDLSDVEADFQRFRDVLVTADAVRSQVASHRLDWIQLACRVATFPGEDMAREAALCVREDGLDLAEVAAAGGCELREGTYFLEDLDASLRDPLLASTTGDLLGPLPVGDGFALVLVTDKIMPSEADPEARRRAEDRLVEIGLDREIERRVRWIQSS